MAISAPGSKFGLFELHIEQVAPASLVRISRYNTNEPYFGKSGGNRFDDPQAVYSTSYFGFTLPCAFAETVLHDEIAGPTGFKLTADQLDRYVLTFQGELLNVAALYGPHLKNLGGNAAVSSMTPYDIPQQWSRAVHDHPAHVDGFLYMSNHLNDQKALVVFDRAKGKLVVSTSVKFEQHPGAAQVLAIFPLIPT